MSPNKAASADQAEREANSGIRGRSARRMIRIARVVVAVGLLSALLLHIGWRDVAAAFGRLTWWWVPCLFAITLFGLFLQSLRWKLFLDTHRIDASTLELFKKYWVSRFFNNFLPGQAGGDASRVLYDWKRSVKKTELASSVIMDRAVGLLGLCLVGAIAGFAHLDLVADVGLGVWPWFAAASAIALLLFLTWRRPTNWAQHATRFLPGRLLRSSAAGVLRDLGRSTEHRGPMVAGVALSGAFYLVAALQAYVAYHAFGVEVPLAGVLLIVPLVALIMAVPISVNGWGVAEVVKVLLYAQLGVAEADALSVALFGRFMLTAVGFMGGLIYLLAPDRAATPYRESGVALPRSATSHLRQARAEDEQGHTNPPDRQRAGARDGMALCARRRHGLASP
ncbi:MAG: lysylphosphatidylglycerol synthase transmembrane domain-containing protein [Pseudomonadota bacterium]